MARSCEKLSWSFVGCGLGLVITSWPCAGACRRSGEQAEDAADGGLPDGLGEWRGGRCGAGGLPELLPPEEALMDEEDAEDAHGGIFIGAQPSPDTTCLHLFGGAAQSAELKVQALYSNNTAVSSNNGLRTLQHAFSAIPDSMAKLELLPLVKVL